MELRLSFPDSLNVSVALIDDEGERSDAPPVPFVDPLTDRDRKDLQWYLETYAASYITEVDDTTADGIAAKLPAWGEALYRATLSGMEAQRLYTRFMDAEAGERLVTIDTGDPAVLAQPWELLRDPARKTWLFSDDPRISIRRRLSGHENTENAVEILPKPTLHLLFVISRPHGSDFLDPHADAGAVMDAIDRAAPGRVTVEFLIPATLRNLTERLRDETRPTVDILHFDGHGVFSDTGYLLFEKPNGMPDLVPSAELGEELTRRKVALTVLSACQSATARGDDPLGGVAARLIASGFPYVLAMTHSVLVDTTRALFSALYGELVGGRTVGIALDNARSALMSNPDRGERDRGGQALPLKLVDWFVPALYQSGDGAVLLKGAAPQPAATAVLHNLPPAGKLGFFGRVEESWAIERAFARGTRRYVVHGFGGQGKTALALNLGRWFVRVGRFDAVCFVDFAGYNGSDPLGFAVVTLASVLGTTLIDTDAATAALERISTYLILDNLESLENEGVERLLTVAAQWSEDGRTRVVVTTRDDRLAHPEWPKRGGAACRYLELSGLHPDDAARWFDRVWALADQRRVPRPDRTALDGIFCRVNFHPLSIGVLASLLTERAAVDVDRDLERYLTREGSPVAASLALSLDRLPPEIRSHLPRLGVFQGGGLESVMRDVTEIPEETWPEVRDGLIRRGLASYDGVFLRFHPTLAPTLRARLPEGKVADLTARWRDAYFELSLELYQLDQPEPVKARIVARAELPNLQAAVHAALDAGAETAVDFAHNVGLFLNYLGLARDHDALIKKAGASAEAVGSRAWILAQSNAGERLYAFGDFVRAAQVFGAVLSALGETPSHKRSTTLLGLARCLRVRGRTEEAASCLRTAIEETAALPDTADTRRLSSALHTDLGDVLTDAGAFDAAREAYQTSLAIMSGIDDPRGVAVVEGQLGYLALLQNDLPEAERRYRAALDTFRGLNEPAAEATVWHQLGRVYQEAARWEEAERAYRESARIKEGRGDLAGAAGTWNQLALLAEANGDADAAEAWYRKAEMGRRSAGDIAGLARTLNNLADLLSRRPKRLAEARAAGEEALRIKQAADPSAMAIWKTHAVLARIAAAEGREGEARKHRRAARDTFAAAPHSDETLRRNEPMIADIVAAFPHPAQCDELFEEMTAANWGSLVDALRRVQAGERDLETLADPLNWAEYVILREILRRLSPT